MLRMLMGYEPKVNLVRLSKFDRTGFSLLHLSLPEEVSDKNQNSVKSK